MREQMQVSRASGRLDALLSLAAAAQAGQDGGPMCRPTVTLTHPNGCTDCPFFQAKALRNATQIKLSGAGAFVPNDVDLGVTDAPFMLLTGPNTGGKSTLMRQVSAHHVKRQISNVLPINRCCRASR
jgi:DNA mismatch repair ATPase MutS